MVGKCEIELHCRKNRISHNLQQRVELILEELITMDILPKLKEPSGHGQKFDFSFTCKDAEEIIVQVTYPEFFGDLIPTGDEISNSILTKMPLSSTGGGHYNIVLKL